MTLAATPDERIVELEIELLIEAMDPELFVHLLAWDDDVPAGCGTVFLHVQAFADAVLSFLESLS